MESGTKILTSHIDKRVHDKTIARLMALFISLMVFMTIGNFFQPTAFLEVNAAPTSLVLYNDQTIFWSKNSGGRGGIGLSIATVTSNVASGTSKLKYQVLSGSKSWVGIYHSYSTSQNWAGYDSFTFWWYGKNTGGAFVLAIEGPDYSNRFSIGFTDNFLGWKKIVIPYGDFTKSGSASWSSVRKITISTSITTQTVWYIDLMALECSGALTYTLTETIVGSGTVTKSPDQTSYASGSIVQLTATPANGYTFTGWSVDLSGSASPTTITMDGNKAVTATFTPTQVNQYTLTLSTVGSGTVTLNPSGGSYTPNTPVTVTATPASGWAFIGWSGDLSGSVNPSTIIMNANKAVTASFTQNSIPTYTIAIEGSSYVVRNSAGTAVVTNTDFGAMWNILDSKLVSGDTILIKAGSYSINSVPVLDKAHITVTGESGAKLLNKQSDVMFKLSGSYNTMKGIAFDDGLVGGQAGAVFIMGSYNTLRECSLSNCIRYGFTTWNADHFSVLNNVVQKAQYGISGSDNGAASQWSSDGLVQGNTVSGCSECCIKMKMWKNVLVTENTLDLCGPSTASDGCIGVCFYHRDTPTQDVTVSYNIILDSSGSTSKGIGVLIAPDNHLDWPNCPYPATGVKILHNIVKNKWFGMIIQGNGAEVDYNDCSAAMAWGIRIDGNNNVLTGNLGSMQNNGSGNTIS